MSICILRAIISESQVHYVLTYIWGDCIDHIDVVDKKNPNGRSYQMMFVHFKPTDSPYFIECMNHLELNGELKLMYDDPWYWIIRKNNTRKRSDEEIAREEEIETALCEFNSKSDTWETCDWYEGKLNKYKKKEECIAKFSGCKEISNYSVQLRKHCDNLGPIDSHEQEYWANITEFKQYMIQCAQHEFSKVCDAKKLNFIRKNKYFI